MLDKPRKDHILSFRITEEEREILAEFINSQEITPTESACIRYLFLLGIRAAKKVKTNRHGNMTQTASAKTK